MKIKYARLLGCICLLSMLMVMLSLPATTTAQRQLERTCGTMQGFNERLKRDPEFAQRLQTIELDTQRYVRDRIADGPNLKTGVVIIPVVVHVVHNTAAENISDAQIFSQIEALNKDFRKMNSDTNSVPDPFKPLRADTRIQFQLAVRDPNCGPTTGITRTSTSVTSFSHDSSQPNMTGHPVKFNASGGHDAWPSDKYLNIWVADLSGGLLGYASFPGDPAAIDGVVIDFEAFGTNGTAAAPFNLGRTTTHEVGHWLNLRHIWGDDSADPDVCLGTDFVDDTPNQGVMNFGCPVFPSTSCTNAPDGDMFMNYMDYTDDACMFMFTVGQSLRMDATLYGVRSAILGSDALIPPTGAITDDLWSQDTPEDVGAEPNGNSTYFYVSDDIWVRRQNDGFTNQEHENPLYRPAGPSNFVYVRVRNRGCTNPATGTVKLYWAKASTGLAWPAPWDGSVTMPALLGDPIGSQSTGSVPPGGFVVLEFPWSPPNPADYASFGADAAHFCLLSRIETSSSPPYGMAFVEGPNLGENVRNNNNIVWKNISIVTDESGKVGTVTAGNFTDSRLIARLVFGLNGKIPDTFTFQNYRITVDLGQSLFAKWSAGGKVGGGISYLGGTVIQILQPGAFINNLVFSPDEVAALNVKFTPINRELRCTVSNFHVNQFNQSTGALIGGERFVVKEPCD